MNRVLEISPDLRLPAEDALESAIGIIGKRGRGKSGLVKVLMEELVRVRLPFVAFDPVGVMWGLRSSPDGSEPGLPVLVVGGSHGDLRLDRRAGAEIAKAVVQANVSCIVDFSEESKRVYREFVRDFCHTLFAINDTPRAVVLEEAPELVPQRLRPDLAETFEAVERLVSRGRNRGLGVVLVSQRAATIAKDVLTQVDALFVFGLVSPQDRKALKEWVEAHDEGGKLEEFERGIAALGRQEAWFWAPEAFGGAFRRIRVRDFRTFHPDKTHLRRMRLLESKPVTEDVSSIVSSLGKQLERLSREKEDAASGSRLRVQVRRLERQLEAERSSPRRAEGGAERDRANRRAVEEARAPLLREISALREQVRRTASVAGQVRKAMRILAPVAGMDPLPRPPAATPSPRPEVPSRPAAPAGSAPPVVDGGESHLRAGAVRILRELGRRSPMTLTRAQLGTLAGFTPSGGTFQTYYSQLRRLGYLEDDGSGRIRVTEAGLDFVGEIPPAPTTHEETVEMWKRNLRAGAGRMLQAVVDLYPESISKQELAEQAGFAASGGTYQTYLSILRRNGLVRVQGDEVTATEVLFP